MHDYELYRSAEKLLEQGWMTGGWEEDGAYCLTGAFGRAVWDAAHRDPAYRYAALEGTYSVPQRIWNELIQAARLSGRGQHVLETWNDRPGPFKRQRVLRVVRKLRKRHEAAWLRSLAEADAAERARLDAELDVTVQLPQVVEEVPA